MNINIPCTSTGQGKSGEVKQCSLAKGHTSDHLFQLPLPVQLPLSKRDLAGGAAVSTKIPRIGLIPFDAQVAEAERFEVGIERHREEAWNATSENFEKTNASKDWVIERLNHVIYHTYQALRKLNGQIPWDGEDDAGAIRFGGAALACNDHWKKLKQQPATTGYQTTEYTSPYAKSPEDDTDQEIDTGTEMGSSLPKVHQILRHSYTWHSGVNHYGVSVDGELVGGVTDQITADNLCIDLERALNGR